MGLMVLIFFVMPLSWRPHVISHQEAASRRRPPFPSRTNPADDEMGTLADAASTATPRAGWLDNRSGSFVVDRKAVSERHF